VIRRALTIASAGAALAAAASGCGGSSAKSPLDDALGYLPKATPVAVAVNTNLKDKQYSQLNNLLKRFPFYGLLKQRFLQGFSAGGTRTTFAQVKPLLGNDLVVGFPRAGSGGPSSNDTVVAWKTKDGGKAESLLKKDSQKIGSEEGATLYQTRSGNTTALKGDVIVSAKSRPLVDAALKQRGKDDRLREDTFKSSLKGLPSDAIAKVYGNLQQLLSSSRAAQAKKVPWVGALRTFGSTVTTAPDGLLVDFRAKTEGSLRATQLPIAAGTTAPQIVRRPNEVAVALRDPAQTLRFAEQALEAATPQGALAKATFNRALGVDIDRDLIGVLGSASAISVSLRGKVVARVDLKDASRFKKTLATIAKNLPKAGSLARGTSLTPGPNGLYQLKRRTGRPVFLGVSGKRLVIGDDARRAVKFGGESASSATGAHGALVSALDPRSIVTALLKQRGGAAGALFGGAFVAPLKDLSGYAESETSGLTARFKLTVSP